MKEVRVPSGTDGKGGCRGGESINRDLSGILGLNGIVAETTQMPPNLVTASQVKELSRNVLNVGRKITAAKGPLTKIEKKLLKRANEQEVSWKKNQST